MPNNIALASKYAPIVDFLYQENAITIGMDAPTETPNFTNTPEVKYLHIETEGFGDYSRANGYPASATTVDWRTFRLTIERGTEIDIDRMDNEETLDRTFGTVISELTRIHMVPEMDAYRFAKYASTPSILSAPAATLTDTDIIAAIDEGVRAQNAKEVTQEGKILFVNSDLQNVLNKALSRQWGSDSTVNTVLSGYNNMRIVYVPPRRFNTAVTLNPGTGSFGFTASGSAINFMIIQPSAIVQVVKLLQPKIFDPDDNQGKDTYKYQFRLYHDCFVYENKKDGIYLHPNVYSRRLKTLDY